MKNSFLILFVLAGLTLMVFAYDSILNFVPSDFDVVLLLQNASSTYRDLDNVSLFKFVFKSEGLAFEKLFLDILYEAQEKCGVDRSVFLKAISKDVLIALRGMKLNFEDLTSLDVNYYIDVLKNLSANSIFVLPTGNTKGFARFFASLLGMKLETSGDYLVFKDENVTFFAKEYSGYVILSGSKLTIDAAISSYNATESRLMSVNKDMREFFSKDSGFLMGFFKGDSFKVEMGVEVEKEDIHTKYYTLSARHLSDRLNIVVRQYVEGNLDKALEYITDSSEMGALPFLGNYYIGVSVKSSQEVLKMITAWFSGKSEELDKMSEIVRTVLKYSKGKAYIAGDISGATNVSYAAILDFDLKQLREVERVLVKYGGIKSKDQWRITLEESEVYFYIHGKDFIISNVSKSKFEKYYSIEKLKDYPPFSYLSSHYPPYDIARIFVDLGNVLEKLVGVRHSSCMIFLQTYKKGVFTYSLEVM